MADLHAAVQAAMFSAGLAPDRMGRQGIEP